MVSGGGPGFGLAEVDRKHGSGSGRFGFVGATCVPRLRASRIRHQLCEQAADHWTFAPLTTALPPVADVFWPLGQVVVRIGTNLALRNSSTAGRSGRTTCTRKARRGLNGFFTFMVPSVSSRGLQFLCLGGAQ